MKKLSFWLAAIWLCSAPTIAWADPMNMQMDPNMNMNGTSMPMNMPAPTPQNNQAANSMPGMNMPTGGVTMNHGAGDWAFSYDYTLTHMHGLLDGSSHISANNVLGQGYMQVPKDMTMQMHMFGLMYNPTNRWMLMAMLPYDINDMDETGGVGMPSTMHSEGWGDAQLTAQYALLHNAQNMFHVSAGLSVPTGSIDERGTMQGMPEQRLPYMMQLGSGTYDPLLGLSYEHFYNAWSLGAKANATLRLGQNDQGYRLGNQYDASLFATQKLDRFLSATFRLDGSQVDNIHGMDAQQMPSMDPSMAANLQGGQRLDAVVALNLIAPRGKLAGSGLSAEFGAPVYQHLDGPQLAEDYHFTVGGHLNF